MSDSIWIRELDRKDYNVSYYTREPDGLSGMSSAALAQLVLRPIQEIESLVESVQLCSDKHSLPIPLQLFAGQDLNLVDAEDVKMFDIDWIIPDFLCQAVIDYYTSYADSYNGQDVARSNKQVLLGGAVRTFIWGKTGYQFSTGRNLREGTYWYKRISIAMSSNTRLLPKNYFSIYLRMMDFFLQLETKFGYVIPDINPATEEYIVPDISIGQKFNDFLRSDEEDVAEKRLEYLGSRDPVDFRPSGKNNREIEPYEHIYPVESHSTNNKQFVNSYPLKYAGIFEYYLTNKWIPERFPEYIQQRDIPGFEHLRDKIRHLSSSDAAILRNTILGSLVDFFKPRIEGS